MKTETYQTSPKGRSTKADNAGLSLLPPTLFSFEGQVIKYYNETSKNTSDFIARLISKKYHYSNISTTNSKSVSRRFIMIGVFSFNFIDFTRSHRIHRIVF